MLPEPTSAVDRAIENAPGSVGSEGAAVREDQTVAERRVGRTDVVGHRFVTHLVNDRVFDGERGARAVDRLISAVGQDAAFDQNVARGAGVDHIPIESAIVAAAIEPWTASNTREPAVQDSKRVPATAAKLGAVTAARDQRAVDGIGPVADAIDCLAGDVRQHAVAKFEPRGVCKAQQGGASVPVGVAVSTPNHDHVVEDGACRSGVPDLAPGFRVVSCST